jgi:hypothetical protein
MLSNLFKADVILKGLNRRLKLGDRIVFMENDRFFDVIRNVDWISNHAVLRMAFREAGFKVKIDVRQGNAWEYLFIYGKKVKNK